MLTEEAPRALASSFLVYGGCLTCDDLIVESLLLFYPPSLISANVLEQEKRIRKLSGFRQHNLQRQIGDRPANGAITIFIAPRGAAELRTTD